MWKLSESGDNSIFPPSHLSNKRSPSLDHDTTILDDSYTGIIGRKSKRKIPLFSTGSRTKHKAVKDARDSCELNMDCSDRLCVFCAKEMLPGSSVTCDLPRGLPRGLLFVILTRFQHVIPRQVNFSN